MNKNLIKTGDIVKVITGNYKGKTGKIIDFNRKTNKVKVENMNMKTSFNKQTRQGISTKEGWIDASNVMFFEEDHITKLYRKDGKRFSSKTNKEV